MAAAPGLVTPSEWIPFIIAGEEPGFKELKEAREVMDVLMPLFDSVNEEMGAKGPGCHGDGSSKMISWRTLSPKRPSPSGQRGISAGHVRLLDCWGEHLPAESDDEMEPSWQP